MFAEADVHDSLPDTVASEWRDEMRMRRTSCGVLALCMVSAFTGLHVVARAQESPGARSVALEQLKKDVIAQVDARRQLTQQMVDSLFSFSEIGFQEVETERYITGILEKNGFTIRRGVADIPTAWVATGEVGGRWLRSAPTWTVCPRRTRHQASSHARSSHPERPATAKGTTPDRRSSSPPRWR